MENLAQKFAKYITQDTNLDYEIVKYGTDAIFSTILCFSIALLTCFLFNNLLFGVTYIILLTPLKMQFLGFHCKTMHRCIFTYSLLAVLSLHTYNFIAMNNPLIHFSSYLILMIILCFIVRKEINAKTIKIMIIYFLLNILFYLIAYKLFVISILTIIVEIILVLPVHLKKLPKLVRMVK